MQQFFRGLGFVYPQEKAAAVFSVENALSRPIFPHRKRGVVEITKAEKVGKPSSCVENAYVNRQKVMQGKTLPVEKTVDNVENSRNSTPKTKGKPAIHRLQLCKRPVFGVYITGR